MVRKRLPDYVDTAFPRLFNERAANHVARGIGIAASDKTGHAAHRRLRLVEDAACVAHPCAAPRRSPRREEVCRLATGVIAVVADLRVVDPVSALDFGECV